MTRGARGIERTKKSTLHGCRASSLPHFSHSLVIPESHFFSTSHFFQSFPTSGFSTELMLVEMKKELFSVAPSKSYFIFEGHSRRKREKEGIIHNHTHYGQTQPLPLSLSLLSIKLFASSTLPLLFLSS